MHVGETFASAVERSRKVLSGTNLFGHFVWEAECRKYWGCSTIIHYDGNEFFYSFNESGHGRGSGVPKIWGAHQLFIIKGNEFVNSFNKSGCGSMLATCNYYSVPWTVFRRHLSHFQCWCVSAALHHCYHLHPVRLD